MITRYRFTLWIDSPTTDGVPDYSAREVELLTIKALRKLELDSDLEFQDALDVEDPA